VIAGSGRASDGSGRPVGGHHERFAALIEASRTAIMASCQTILETSNNPLGSDPCCGDQLEAIGSQIITDVVESVQAGGIRIDDGYRRLASTIGEIGARRELRPEDSLRAAMLFFEGMITTLASHVRDDPDLLPAFVVGLLALNKTLAMGVEQATFSYTSYLLNHIHKAHLEERRRIARELHDRLGEGLSVALRQLELHEITAARRPSQPDPQTAMAREALVESMRRLRVVTSDLRHEPVTSLEKALTQYLDSVSAEADVRLRITGDETWASAAVLDEVFLIVREAIRNALKHGAPRQVMAAVDLVPQELRACVRDDGCGFVPADAADSARAGTFGLATMRERAAIIHGKLTVSSAPGRGTCVELVVPLPGYRDEQSG
jgi:signal transduction histidine kinase